MSISFGSYLEKLFTPDLFSCRTGGCYHDSSKFHIRYFAKGYNVASIQVRRIPVYSAIPSQPFQIDPRYKRNYHDALGNSLKEACIRQYSMFKSFCSRHIEVCETRKNVFEISQTEMEVAADWSSIAEDLRKLSIIISEHQIKDLKFGELILNSIDNDGTAAGLDRSTFKLIPESFKNPILFPQS